ncbi:MAG: DUF2279 domain-containing protein [Bacteroidetes bacterium]|nr:MAG: DUF2279 domain-containing protein [Bacteroidota bacterium]REJ99925.1 MAG: DUF2279 domain-containing protein [Bacteroidota bacterium]REK35895.1 MAG: DUF2279 domain-containing protein [Bacteroidota bacterium]REK50628.1 MAG: DUF2279 domain-containing protein [Bacteroidota bacterium]
MHKYILISFLFLLALKPGEVYCQKASDTLSIEDPVLLDFYTDADSPHKGRTRLIAGGTLGLYPLSMYWLYTQWYQNYPTSSFHFFNDNKEWEGMDKFAHVWDAYSIAKPLMHSFRWAGHGEKRSTLYASGIAFLYQTTVEVFDGFSAEWGFSGGDFLANTAGAAFFAGQQLLWNEQKITLKYSFRRTDYAQYRPELLGSNLPEEILKDYNGLTYWASINPRSFSSHDLKFPKWISIGIGFGAEGMTGGHENVIENNGRNIPEFERYRQYYFGLDLDLARVDFKSKFLNGFFRVINVIHLPAPALEIRTNRKPVWHWLYF